jgi:nicotinamidase-related amidase
MDVPFRYDPANCALILVDVQNDFCHPDGSIAKAGEDVAAAVAMVPRLVKLLDAARRAEVPVVFVRTTHDESNDSAAWLNRRAAGPGAVTTQAICRTASWGAEFYKVTPELPDEPVITKHRYSAFAGTNLDLTLRTMGVQSLLFTGVATEVCVESSLRDGLFVEYFVSMVADCCATYAPELHAGSVRAVAKFGTVVTAAELSGYWSAAGQALAG